MTERHSEIALCADLACARLRIYHMPDGRVDDKRIAGELWFSDSGACTFEGTTSEYDRWFAELLAEPFELRVGGMTDDGALWDGVMTVQRDRPHTVLHFFSSSTPMGLFDRETASWVSRLIKRHFEP